MLDVLKPDITGNDRTCSLQNNPSVIDSGKVAWKVLMIIILANVEDLDNAEAKPQLALEI